MGIAPVLIIAIALSIIVLSIWLNKGPGDKRKRVYVYLAAMSELGIAWVWIIPFLFKQENNELTMVLSLALLAIPLIIPSLWKRIYCQ